MKKILLFSLLLISINAFSQIQVLTSNTDTNDLVYDETTNRIYASIPSSNGLNGNSIGIINPNTSTLENTTPIGNEPTVLAISDDGAYIYTGFENLNVVKRLEVATKNIFEIDLGTDPSNGDYLAEDIEVIPGFNTSIAVSRMNNGTFSQRFEGVVIFDQAIQRSNSSSDTEITNVIEFADANTMFGLANETEDVDLRQLTVDTNGVTVNSATTDVLSGEGLDFIFNDGRIYTTDGNVINLASSPPQMGQFADANGPVIFDSELNLVCYASFDAAGVITFKRYDPDTFLLVDDTDITQAVGTVKSLTKCGSGCYAFNTSDDKVVIVRNLLLGVTEFLVESKISLYPNPSTDFVSVKSTREIKSLTVLDVNGRTVFQTENIEDKIDVRNLSVGMYLVKLIDFQNQVYTEKLLKR